VVSLLADAVRRDDPALARLVDFVAGHDDWLASSAADAAADWWSDFDLTRPLNLRAHDCSTLYPLPVFTERQLDQHRALARSLAQCAEQDLLATRHGFSSRSCWADHRAHARLLLADDQRDARTFDGETDAHSNAFKLCLCDLGCWLSTTPPCDRLPPRVYSRNPQFRSPLRPPRGVSRRKRLTVSCYCRNAEFPARRRSLREPARQLGDDVLASFRDAISRAEARTRQCSPGWAPRRTFPQSALASATARPGSNPDTIA
jgi:hypothetical protein